MTSYGFGKRTSYGYEKAIDRVTEELKKEGFGVLTAIDVADTLKKKLNVDFMKYAILGACNPSFAHAALMAEEEIGLLLPCNVIVYEKSDGVHVGAFDPMVMVKVMENPAIKPIADEVQARLKRVISAV